MADRETEVIARIASGVSGLNDEGVGSARRRGPVRQPRLPVVAGGFGKRRPWHRLDAGADPDRGRCVPPDRRRARLSQEPQPGRICVRPWLGRSMGARRRRILSQAAGRRAVHPGAGPEAARHPRAASARRDRNRGGAERDFVGAHHLPRRSGRGGVRAAQMADPPRRPISLVQSRLFELRRLPRRTSEASSARRSARSARRPATGWSSATCAGRRSVRPNGTRCGPSTRTPAAANGASRI